MALSLQIYEKEDLKKTRNLGIMAHIDAGKTTLSERFLFYTGRSYKMGEVHHGSTVMDWMEQEQKRGITITSAATTCLWNHHIINLIDTPGHVDFTLEVERSLRVLDGAIAVFDGVHGVESQSETVWRQADKYKVPRICFINKMDRVGADFSFSVESLKKRLQAHPAVIQYPVGSEDQFEGVIDIISSQYYTWPTVLGEKWETHKIPQPYQKKIKQLRDQLIEQICELDETLMEKFIKEEPLSEQEIKVAIRKLTLDLKITPVLCGSAFKNKGVQLVLDAVIDYLPSPADIPPVEGKTKEGRIQKRQTHFDEKTSALAFKISVDSYAGAMTYIRVYSGEVKTGSLLLNSRVDKKERMGKLVKVHAGSKQDTNCLKAGDIGAVLGLKWTRTGDTLCGGDSLFLEPIQFPEPVISVAVEAQSLTEQKKMMAVLKELQKEDPSFSVKSDRETGQILMEGMGELHLEVLIHRLKNQFKLKMRVGKPRVFFKETILKKVSVDHLFEKEIAGKKQYAKVALSVYPLERGRGIQFQSKVKNIPENFVQAIKEGVMESSSIGEEHPLQDVGVDLLGWEYKEGESSDLAFKVSASQAFHQGVKKSGCLILEPVFKLEIITPEEFVGDVVGDLHSRRGKVDEIHSKGSVQTIQARAPLLHLLGYATHLRSLTQGRASFSMEMEGYEILPEKYMNSVT